MHSSLRKGRRSQDRVVEKRRCRSNGTAARSRSSHRPTNTKSETKNTDKAKAKGKNSDRTRSKNGGGVSSSKLQSMARDSSAGRGICFGKSSDLAALLDY